MSHKTLNHCLVESLARPNRKRENRKMQLSCLSFGHASLASLAYPY